MLEERIHVKKSVVKRKMAKRNREEMRRVMRLDEDSDT